MCNLSTRTDEQTWFPNNLVSGQSYLHQTRLLLINQVLSQSKSSSNKHQLTPSHKYGNAVSQVHFWALASKPVISDTRSSTRGGWFAQVEGCCLSIPDSFVPDLSNHRGVKKSHNFMVYSGVGLTLRIEREKRLWLSVRHWPKSGTGKPSEWGRNHFDRFSSLPPSRPICFVRPPAERRHQKGSPFSANVTKMFAVFPHRKTSLNLSDISLFQHFCP